ncbi:aaas-prov protein [Thecamonas trahens ATCC 50062]|uniref:Aaas-prov protein n=1 Tax=Thecamonas trahens ATCC 50062 TaxID=461836 RepID=A0A0L0D4U7_THETB|nr:aaas-prov protein [Thecamonas trahens ATCC 50062]KNC47392.1 aaas-prov protein [Thecamonas trahens ATCC 50062]|eukprot:XP_013759730.1 aaas-prov protein [Thecamonas trahens ATCC 50062]
MEVVREFDHRPVLEQIPIPLPHTQQTICELDCTMINVPSSSDAQLHRLYKAEGVVYPALHIPPLPETPEPFTVPTLKHRPSPLADKMAAWRAWATDAAAPLLSVHGVVVWLVAALLFLLRSLRIMSPDVSREKLPAYLGGAGWVGTMTSVRKLAWHPYLHRLGVALRDGSVHVYDLMSQEWIPFSLRHEFQQDVFSMAWQPQAGHVLAVGTASGVAVWLGPCPHPHPWMRFLTCGEGPVTSLSWHPAGTHLAMACPSSSDLIVWSMELGLPTRLARSGAGTTLVSWSPSGHYLLAATNSGVFRIWETATWACERWSLEAPVNSAVWSADSNFLLLSLEGCSEVYAMRLDASPPVIDAQFCQVHHLPATPNTTATFDRPAASRAAGKADAESPGGDDEPSAEPSHPPPGSVTLGGAISSLAWDDSSERLVVAFRDSPYMLTFHATTSPVFKLAPRGVIKACLDEDADGVPLSPVFRPNFGRGALLASVAANSSTISFVPMYFIAERDHSRMALNKW